MTEPRRIPTSIPPITAPTTDDELLSWAKRITALMVQTFQRIVGSQIVTMENVPDGQFLLRSGPTVIGSVGGGSGDSITVNGVAVVDADFDDTTPAAPVGGENVRWQKDAASPANISAYVREATAALRGIVQLAGQLGGTATSPDVRGIRETSGPTLLTLGTVADGQLLQRSGATVIGVASAPSISLGLVEATARGMNLV